MCKVKKSGHCCPGAERTQDCRSLVMNTHTNTHMRACCRCAAYAASLRRCSLLPICASSVRLCAALRGDSLPITWYANAKCESVQLFTAAYILMMHKA